MAEFHRHLARCGQLVYPSGHPTVRGLGAQHFLAFVQSEGLASAPATTASMAAPPPLLVEFQHWMHMHRGVTEQTLRNYYPIILDLLTTLEGRLEPLEAKGLRAFILDHARRHGKGAAKNVVTAIRMFVRFLIAIGRCAPGLLATCPDGRDHIGRHMLALTTYMGHARVKSTYWYLEQSPQLMGDSAQTCEACFEQERS